MAMTRYNPWNAGDLQNEINRLFNNWGDNESSSATAGWMPNVDIEEYTDRFQLFVDLPGVKPDEVEITMDNGILTIVGERQFHLNGGEEKSVHRRSERGKGRFYRRFSLPDTVDAEKIEARGNHGVLEITIPKQAKAQPKRIKVAA